MRSLFITLFAVLALFAVTAASQAAKATQDFKDKDRIFGITGKFTATDGQTLYRENCRGCHMPNGEGAQAAGMYPQLARNPNVESPDYIAYVILHGLRGMPSFEADLDDEQVAAVAAWVSNNLDNKGSGKLTADEVKGVRAKPVVYIDW